MADTAQDLEKCHSGVAAGNRDDPWIVPRLSKMALGAYVQVTESHPQHLFFFQHLLSALM